MCPAMSSFSQPLSQSFALIKVQHSPSSLSFSFVSFFFSYKACMLKSSQERNAKWKKTKKTLRFKNTTVPTRRLHSLIIQETLRHVNMPFSSGSQASWLPEAVQLIWKKTKAALFYILNAIKKQLQGNGKVSRTAAQLRSISKQSSQTCPFPPPVHVMNQFHQWEML